MRAGYNAEVDRQKKQALQDVKQKTYEEQLRGITAQNDENEANAGNRQIARELLEAELHLKQDQATAGAIITGMNGIGQAGALYDKDPNAFLAEGLGKLNEFKGGLKSVTRGQQGGYVVTDEKNNATTMTDQQMIDWLQHIRNRTVDDQLRIEQYKKKKEMEWDRQNTPKLYINDKYETTTMTEAEAANTPGWTLYGAQKGALDLENIQSQIDNRGVQTMIYKSQLNGAGGVDRKTINAQQKIAWDIGKTLATAPNEMGYSVTDNAMAGIYTSAALPYVEGGYGGAQAMMQAQRNVLAAQQQITSQITQEFKNPEERKQYVLKRLYKQFPPIGNSVNRGGTGESGKGGSTGTGKGKDKQSLKGSILGKANGGGSTNKAALTDYGMSGDDMQGAPTPGVMQRAKTDEMARYGMYDRMGEAAQRNGLGENANAVAYALVQTAKIVGQEAYQQVKSVGDWLNQDLAKIGNSVGGLARSFQTWARNRYKNPQAVPIEQAAKEFAAENATQVAPTQAALTLN